MMMCAQILTIERKTRPDPISLVDIDADFQYSPDQFVDPAIVLENSQWSVYCLDDARRRVIFVETPSHVDLSVAPLVYIAQYEHAERLLAVSYEELIALADSVPVPQNIIFIFHSSRCGSTLLSQAFSEIAHVASFSEPDYFTQMVLGVREPDGNRDGELAAILRACTLLSCRATSHKPDAKVFAFKPRGTVQEAGDLFRQALPDSINLLMYRHAEATLNSWLGAFPRLGLNADDLAWEGDDTSYRVWQQYGGARKITVYDWFILHWLSSLDSHLNLHRKGMPFLAVRYEDLNANREQVLGAILDYCHISREYVTDMLRAFSHDAQAGTHIARANPDEGNRYKMTDAERERLLSILRMHPVINTSDYIVPGTLKLP